jgi:hypothetical protein
MSKSKEFKLPKKQVHVIACPNNGPFAESLAKLNARSFGNSAVTLCADFDSALKLVNTGLTEEEQVFLEKALGLQEGGLNNYPTNPFWESYFIKLQFNTEVLNLESPIDYLKYKVLLASDKVANSEDEILPSSLYYIEDVEDASEKLSSRAEQKVEAVDKFNSLSEDDRARVFKIYGYKTDGNTTKFIKGKLFELLEENPAKFLQITSKPKERIVMEAFILDLKNNGVIREVQGSFFDQDVPLGDMDILVQKLLSPKHQEEYLVYKEKLQHFSK